MSQGSRAPLDLAEDVVRHFSGGRLDDGRLVSGALTCPPDHDGEMSFDRLHFYGEDVEESLAAIRRTASIKLRKSGRYLQWNAGEFLAAAQSELSFAGLSWWSDPLLETNASPANPAHAVLAGVPSDTLNADLLLDLVRPLVKRLHPAVVD